MKCALNYIPEHLHSDDKPIKHEFIIGEKLFYRCKPENCKKPYDNISLYDISHNRDFGIPDEFKKDDVLFNILENSSDERYNLEVVELEISNLNGKTTFHKEIISQDVPDLKVDIKLVHSPVPCMYPHSVFEISIGDVVVDRNNYKSVLNKKSIPYKNLRSDIRQELTSIIQTKIIDSSQDIEYLSEP